MKRHLRLLIMLLMIVLLLSSVQTALAYSPQGPLRVGRVLQKGPAGNNGDCHYCSIATVEAYALGSYNGVTYTYGNDYLWKDDPVWNLVSQKGIDDVQNYPVPLKRAYSLSLDQLLQLAYEKLQDGSPIAIWAQGINQEPGWGHASVIISYNGNGSTLKASDFTIMEIKLSSSQDGTGWWKNSPAYFEQYAAAPQIDSYSGSLMTCYVTLDSWIALCQLYQTFNVTYIPVAKKLLTTVAQNGSFAEQKTGRYQEGEVIQLTATANPGYIFKEWTTSNGGTFSNIVKDDKYSSSCSFTMPDCDTTVTAVFTEDLNATITEWVSANTTSTETDASITGIFHTKRALVSFNFSHPKVTSLYCYVGRSRDAVACATPQSHASTVYFHAADPSGAVDGRDKTYSYTVSSVNSLKDDSNATLGLKAGETYYYKWLAVVDGKQVASAVQQGNLPSPSGYWYNTAVATDSPFNSVFKYNSNLLFVEDGCFVSTDRNKVLSATKDNHPDVIFKNESNANGFSYWTEGDYKHTKVFYNLPFSTLTSFEPGVPYYYKFYAVTSNGSVIYTPDIGCYTAPAVTTYPLTIKANTGGTITTGTSGSYAPGTVIQLGALPNAGYKFGSWTSTAGELRNGTSTSASFVMPASAATVTANFGYESYTISSVVIEGEGTISGISNTAYPTGSKLDLTATPADGYVFKAWSSTGGGTFGDINNPSTTFITPGNETFVRAEFITKEAALQITKPDLLQIQVGIPLQLKATGEMSSSVTWTTSDPSIATVTSTGILTGLKPGRITVTATAPHGISDELSFLCTSQDVFVELMINGKLATGFSSRVILAEVGDTLDIKLTHGDIPEGASTEWEAVRNGYLDNEVFEFISENQVRVTKAGKAGLGYSVYEMIDGEKYYLGSASGRSVIILDPERTLKLPATLTTLESEALAGTSANAIVIPDSVTTIGSNITTLDTEFVFIILDSSINRNIADNSFPSNSAYIVDIGPQYNYDFFIYCDTHDWKYSYAGNGEESDD